jgi:5-methylthioadenosine/S-adenosylhomocysteine deaminase
MEWLRDHIWPAEKNWVSRSFVEDGTRLAATEMLLSGTTCFNDMYFFPEATGQVAEEIGIRACVGLILLDFPTNWAKDGQEYLEKAQSAYQRFQFSPLVRAALAPHAPYSVSDDLLREAAAMAERLDVPLHIHVHETAAEVAQSLEKHGMRPLARLEKLGLLNSRLQAVHFTQADDEELLLLAERGAHVVHCPESNMKLASGFCPVKPLLELGVNVALGTDGPASNDDLDMLGELRSAALLGKAVSSDAGALPAAQVLRMATLNGARALGIDKLAGSLSPGKAADIVALDLRHPATQPVYHPLSQLVYSASRQQITDVWVAGRHVVKESNLTTVDHHALRRRIHVWREKILAGKAGNSLSRE